MNRRIFWLFGVLALYTGVRAGNGPSDAGLPVYKGPPTRQFFREWLVCGPFPNPLPPGLTQYRHDSTSLGFYRDYLSALGGEAHVRPQEGQTVRRPDGRTVRWRQIRSFFPQVVLDDVFTPNDSSVAYAACVVRADRAKRLVLAISANDGVRVWQNGQLILDCNMPGTDEPDRDYLPVQLRQGDNLFLLKISEGFGRWGFHFRFLDLQDAREVVRTGLSHFLTPAVSPNRDGWAVTLGRPYHVEILKDRPRATLSVLAPGTREVEYSAEGLLGDTVLVPFEALLPGEHFLRVAIPWGGETLAQLGWLYKGKPPTVSSLVQNFRKLKRPRGDDLPGWARAQIWKSFDFHLTRAESEGNVPAFYRTRMADVLDRYRKWTTERPGTIYEKVLPKLKRVSPRQRGTFRLGGFCWISPAARCTPDLSRFLQTVQSRHGIQLQCVSDPASARLVFATLRDSLTLRKLGFRYPSVVPGREAYWMQVTPERAVVVGASPDGLHNALVTCRWLADMALNWPAATIVDWPSYPVRSAYIHVDLSLPEAEKTRLLTFVDLKYNAMSFASGGFYQLDDPAIRARLAKVVDFLRQYHVQVVPYVGLAAGKDGREGVYLQDEPVRFIDGRARLPVERLLDLPSTRPLLASAPIGQSERRFYRRGIDWDVLSVEPPVLVALPSGQLPPNGRAFLTADIVDRREHRYVKACPAEETVYKVHRRTVEAVVRAFHPKMIHLGHDEVGLVKGDSRCLRTGLPGFRLFADQLSRAFENVARADAQVDALLWADSVNPFHNAGKKELDRTAALLPRRIIMAHWFYGANGPEDVDLIDRGASFFLRLGFRIVGCPWDDPANHQLWEETLARTGLRNPLVLGVMHTEWSHRDSGKVLTAMIGWNRRTWLTEGMP